MTPMAAPKALDHFFLEARARLLDVAAILDRIDRGEGSAANDPRVARIKQAIEVLNGTKEGRAERIQQIFSLDYDGNWKRPQPH